LQKKVRRRERAEKSAQKKESAEKRELRKT